MNRRQVIAAPLALAACSRGETRAEARADIPPLKSLAPFPLGVAAMTEQFADPAWDALARTHFDRVTPEWEMKAEAVVGEDGGFDWSRPDRLMALAEERSLDVFGHTVVWYSQVPPSFAGLDSEAFRAAYSAYVRTFVGRWRGRVRAWDVVNEPVRDDGGYRTDNGWARALGMDYVRLAFEHAREADPDAVLFLNDYNLEQIAAKRRDFLRLAEDLLKAGAPLGGLGAQTHVPADLPAGAVREAVRELAALGLPVHVSELDVSLNRARGPSRQAAIVGEVVEAVMALPEPQRFGVTLWGARHRDSWLNRPPERNPLREDRPLLFEDDGRPGPMAVALVEALRAGG